MKQAAITCDMCGTAKDTQVEGEFATLNLHGWFTISHNGYVVAAEPVPAGSTAYPRPPDLCSWECVAAFAQKRAAAS